MKYYQETNSKIVFSLPTSFCASSIEPVNMTTAGSPDVRIFSSLRSSRLFGVAWRAVHKESNPVVAEKAAELLSIIQDTLTSFENFDFPLGYLPPLRGVNVEDGSILLEWISTEFRVGFSIEPEPYESSWYLVASERLGQIDAFGYIPPENTEKLILWLLNFVLSNS